MGNCMLCESVKEKEADKFFFNSFWKANTKFDGERIIATKEGDKVLLINRNGRIKNSHYSEVVMELETYDFDFIIDGEMIDQNDDFNILQKRALTTNKEKQSELMKKFPVKYMIFDILKIDSEDLREKPLSYRIKFSTLFLDDSEAFIDFAEYKPVNEMLRIAKDENREGIVIKNMEAEYENKRSKNWVKCKFFKETELLLQQYTINNAGIRATDKNENVVQISGQQHLEVKQQIDNTGSCEVSVQYLEKGKTGRLRFPSFRGITDKQKNEMKECREDKFKYEAQMESFENETL